MVGRAGSDAEGCRGAAEAKQGRSAHWRPALADAGRTPKWALRVDGGGSRSRGVLT